MSNTLQKSKSSLIKEVFKKARRIVKHSGLDILVAPKSTTPAHLFIITPGHIGNAIQRNKIRRRIKAIFQNLVGIKQTFNCIIIVKKEGSALSYDQLQTIIMEALATTNK